MKRLYKELLLDLKEPGLNISLLPVISVLFVVGAFLVHRQLGDNDTLTLAAFEVLYPFLGGYAAIMIMQSILDTEGCEILFTYPRSNAYWGIFREVRLYILFALFTIPICMAVASVMEISFLSLYFLTLSQSATTMAIGFFGISMSRKVSIGLIVLIAFIGIQLTLGREISFLNWIFALSGRFPEQRIQIGIYVRSLLISCVGVALGQMWVRA